jgi:hypothetical protein
VAGGIGSFRRLVECLMSVAVEVARIKSLHAARGVKLATVTSIVSDSASLLSLLLHNE